MASRGLEQCVAIAHYDAIKPDELSFRKGDALYVTAKGGVASGYWTGYVCSAPSSTGLFPSCFVTSNERAEQPSQRRCRDRALCLYDYTPTPEAAAEALTDRIGVEREMTFQRGDILVVVGPSSQLGWWLGVNLSVRHRYLVAHVQRGGESPSAADAMRALRNALQEPDAAEVLERLSASLGSTTAVDLGHMCGTRRRPLRFPIEYVTCDLVQAAFSFTARSPHELSFTEGDVVAVRRRWADGWWEGWSCAGQRGIFPSNYTIANIPTTSPPLFCRRCKHIIRAAELWQTCPRCEQMRVVREHMLQALKDHSTRPLNVQKDEGEHQPLDLFAYIPQLPVEVRHHGGGRPSGKAPGPSLLTAEDIVDVQMGRVKHDLVP